MEKALCYGRIAADQKSVRVVFLSIAMRGPARPPVPSSQGSQRGRRDALRSADEASAILRLGWAAGLLGDSSGF